MVKLGRSFSSVISTKGRNLFRRCFVRNGFLKATFVATLIEMTTKRTMA